MFGIDFVKNLMISAQCFAAMSFGRKQQQTMAAINVAMCLGCLATQLRFPTGPSPPPAAIAYLATVPAAYIFALMTSAPEASSKKAK